MVTNGSDSRFDVDAIGTLPASLTTYLAIQKTNPKIVISAGTCGGFIAREGFVGEIILADIPGIISGAHRGKGLGHKFLAHIERCKIILHLVDSSKKNYIENYFTVKKELEKYGREIKYKKEIIALSKSDLVDDKITEISKNFKKKTKYSCLFFSSYKKYFSSFFKMPQVHAAYTRN